MTNKAVPQPSEAWTTSEGIPGILICIFLAGGSFWAYFNGYVLAIKRLSLGRYSFLVLGILFLICAGYNAYEYYQEKKSPKTK